MKTFLFSIVILICLEGNAQKNAISLTSDRSIDYLNDWHWIYLGYSYELHPKWSLYTSLGYGSSILYVSKSWGFNAIPRSVNEIENLKVQIGVSKVSFLHKEHVKMSYFTKFGFSKTPLCSTVYDSNKQGLGREYSDPSLLLSNFTGINLKVKLGEIFFFEVGAGWMYFYQKDYFRGPNLWRFGNEFGFGLTF